MSEKNDDLRTKLRPWSLTQDLQVQYKTEVLQLSLSFYVSEKNYYFSRHSLLHTLVNTFYSSVIYKM